MILAGTKWLYLWGSTGFQLIKEHSLISDVKGSVLELHNPELFS